MLTIFKVKYRENKHKSNIIHQKDLKMQLKVVESNKKGNK